MNFIELRTHIRKFSLKLQLIEFFADKYMREDDSLVKPESTFTPYQQRDTILDKYIDFLIKYPLEEMAQKQEKAKNNLNKAQWNGILNLKKDKTLVIKESNKGRACVIMDESFYNDKILELLNDCETYKELEKNIDAGILQKIRKLTEKYKEQLTPKEIQYLTKFDHQMSQFKKFTNAR